MKILELKNTVIELKNLVDCFSDRLDHRRLDHEKKGSASSKADHLKVATLRSKKKKE